MVMERLVMKHTEENKCKSNVTTRLWAYCSFSSVSAPCQFLIGMISREAWESRLFAGGALVSIQDLNWILYGSKPVDGSGTDKTRWCTLTQARADLLEPGASVRFQI